MSSQLLQLRLGLGHAFSSTMPEPESWSDPSGMIAARVRVQQTHGSAGIEADSRTISSYISVFRRSGKINEPKALKYVCLGLTAVDDDGRMVIEDSRLRRIVFTSARSQPEMRRRVRLFQALLAAYWVFPLYEERTSDEARAGWVELREWLAAERENIVSSKCDTPPWFTGLLRHAELLTGTPCREIGAALLKNDSGLLNDAVETLAIPKDSWLMDEAIWGQVEDACARSDSAFRELIPRLLPTVMGKGGIETLKRLQIRCTSKLVSRYAKCADRPEQVILRDAAVAAIGNPWLHRPKWDAWVVDDKGKPDRAAREMVNGWLKRRLISDFFTLLSIDGAGDQRRVDYWLRFEPLIEDMWFALGPDAWSRQDSSFNEFKSRARGRLLDLDDSTPDNNAFVMRINGYLAVEFGAKGNAFFLFGSNDLGPELEDALRSGLSRARVSRAWLKATNYKFRGIHIDSVSQTWEQKFDERLCPLLGRPSVLPRASRAGPVRRKSSAINEDLPSLWIFREFVKKHQLTVTDHRPAQGALWVLGDHLTESAKDQLKAWGFRYRSPRGWFKE